jgi:hypothetical protein
VVAGGGGFPPNAAESLRLSSLQPNPAPVQNNPKVISQVIQEATNWQKSPNGKISLIITAPSQIATLSPNCATSNPIR